MIRHLNDKLYTDLPLDELEDRVSIEELEDRLELICWNGGGVPICTADCPTLCKVNIVLPPPPPPCTAYVNPCPSEIIY